LDRSVPALLTPVLLFGAGLVPVDNVEEIPMIFVELKFKLAILETDAHLMQRLLE
jgi:hypothetical protein